MYQSVSLSLKYFIYLPTDRMMTAAVKQNQRRLDFLFPFWTKTRFKMNGYELL